ncbi:hypothetical protein LZK98_04805 [Sphingomonas cannabina]|uniref:hypothetical protein n=1 Tax=Sphingomonas cannabina TaxID=2899123 RepID=UPI001F3B1C86|nr:hypothetical protein [Sphingomonas cannabina]UIJ46270.1 hypothetical protein LZK98_04805 [Sphingomonas cannabina]
MMKLYLVTVAAFFATAASPSHAQFYDPGMVNNQANIFLNAEINRVTINTGPARSSGSSNRSGRASSRNDIADRVQVAALEALRPGLQRHWREDGETKAKQWYMRSASRIGTQMGSLLAEYNRRFRAQGRGAADAWYIRSAQEAGARISAED